MKYYTGVGSRETPASISTLMTQLAEKLASEGWALRSGGAEGADKAFELGSGGSDEIYLPWKGFNKSDSSLYLSALATDYVQEAFQIAKSIHPNWGACSPAAKKLHTRNIFQVLGSDLNTSSKFLICWTKDGLPSGGTRTAIVLAERDGVPVYNLGDLKFETVMRGLLTEPNLGMLLAGPRGMGI